jgi:hypothetical protein
METCDADYPQINTVIFTDFSLQQITHLACLLKDIPADNILQESMRPEWTRPGPNGSLLWNQNSLMLRLRELGLTP